MFSLWNLVVSAVALCSTVRHTVTTVSLTGIVERGHRGVGFGRAALVASLHVSSLTLSGSSRFLDDVRYPDGHDTAALYDVTSADGLDSNATRYLARVESTRPVLTALPYSGTKALTVYDIRRELVVYNRGPQELTVYNRPSALIVYMPPIDYTTAGRYPLPYQLAIHVYCRLFQFDARRFQAYAHWDYQALEHWITGIAGEWPNSRELLTIGEFQRRPEEKTAPWFARLEEFGILISVIGMVLSKLRRLRLRQLRAAPTLDFEFGMEEVKFASKVKVDMPTALRASEMEAGTGIVEPMASDHFAELESSLPILDESLVVSLVVGEPELRRLSTRQPISAPTLESELANTVSKVDDETPQSVVQDFGDVALFAASILAQIETSLDDLLLNDNFSKSLAPSGETHFTTPPIRCVRPGGETSTMTASTSLSLNEFPVSPKLAISQPVLAAREAGRPTSQRETLVTMAPEPPRPISVFESTSRRAIRPRRSRR